MNATELKQNIHLLIDSIENENLLASFYDLIKKRSSAEEGQLWHRLSNQEQEELITSLNESENPDYLISNDEMKKKHGKLL